MLQKSGLAALFIANYAVQQAKGDCSGTFSFTGSISNYVSTCTTWTGDIILTSATPNAEIGYNVPQLRAIEGNLILKNAPLNVWSLSGLETIEDSFVLDNLPSLNTLDLPLLKKVGSLEWNGLHGFTAGLTSPLVTAGNISIKDTSLSDLYLEQLRDVQNIKVDNNPYLTSLKADNVKRMDGDLIITGNEDLKNINGFSNLQSVSGNIELTGDFFDLKLPMLNSVENMTLESSQDIETICKRFKIGDPVQGILDCNGKLSGVTTPLGNSNSSPGSTDSNDNGGLSSGAKIGIGVGVGVGALLVVALFSMFFIRRRRKQVAASAPSQTGTSDPHMAQVYHETGLQSKGPDEGLSRREERYELGGPSSLSELPAQYEGPEMGRNVSSRYPGVESRYEK